MTFSVSESQEQEEATTREDKTEEPPLPVHQELARLINNFAGDTTLHGLANLFKKRETSNPFKWKNIMFLFAITASMICLVINLQILWEDYSRWPVTTSTIRSRNQSRELPAVTVCQSYNQVSCRISYYIQNCKKRGGGTRGFCIICQSPRNNVYVLLKFGRTWMYVCALVVRFDFRHTI